jgi:hypothetical protein
MILALLLALLLVGCDGNTVSKQPAHKEAAASLISSSNWQDVYEVPFSNMKAFLETHSKQRIQSISSVNRGGDGMTSSFIVVLEKS